jgi:murein DD-endopeptidase MepM/ murein hydrolase activator NlpD
VEFCCRQLPSAPLALGAIAALAITSVPAVARTAPYRIAVSDHAALTRRTAGLSKSRHQVERGETLTRILRSYGLRQREIAKWDAALQQAAGKLALTPGRALTLEFRSPSELASLSYPVDNQIRVVVERSGRTLRGRTEPLAVKVSVAGAQGVVEKNFHLAARQAGIPDRVISQMADILGWEFDFRRVQRGDRFRVVYERRVCADGRVLPPGKVLAAEIRSGHGTVQAFYYDDDGEGTYADARGVALTQSFLRYPVEFTQISSVFSDQRLHPILKTNRPHNGVDFAAPQGTPVRAAGDGVVSWAGPNGEYGNQVAIDHGDGMVTTYSHLSGIAAGVRADLHVRQGQVVGFVGQTGLATGPHLHFALFRNQQYINPLTARVTLRRSVRDLARFQLAKQTLLTQLVSVPLPAPSGPVEPVTVAGLLPWLRPGVVTLTR